MEKPKGKTLLGAIVPCHHNSTRASGVMDSRVRVEEGSGKDGHPCHILDQFGQGQVEFISLRRHEIVGKAMDSELDIIRGRAEAN